MKRIYASIALLFASANAFAADSFTVTLNSGDSKRFYDALARLGGQVTTPDPSGPGNWTRTAKFVSINQALMLTCNTSFRSGLEMGSACTIGMDADKSDSSQTEIKIGAIGEVRVALIHNVSDARVLARALAPVGYFQTLEQFSITLPNGQKYQGPKVRVGCNVQNGDVISCQVTAFPSN